MKQQRPFSIVPFEQTRWGFIAGHDIEVSDRLVENLPSHIAQAPRPYRPSDDGALVQMLTLRSRGLMVAELRDLLAGEGGAKMSAASQSQALRDLAKLGLVWYSSNSVTKGQRKKIRENEQTRQNPTHELWSTQNPDRVELLALGYVIAERLFNGRGKG
jgi:hypothetical protein